MTDDTQRPDERVEAIRANLDRLNTFHFEVIPPSGIRYRVFVRESVDDLIDAYDEQRARAERLDDIIEFIRTYDPRVVDDAEAKYPALAAAADEEDSVTPAPETPKAIIRHDDDGSVDEIVVDCTSVHLEYMDSGSVWLAVYRGDERLAMFLNSKKRIHCNISEDDLGCVNDRDES